MSPRVSRHLADGELARIAGEPGRVRGRPAEVAETLEVGSQRHVGLDEAAGLRPYDDSSGDAGMETERSLEAAELHGVDAVELADGERGGRAGGPAVDRDVPR